LTITPKSGLSKFSQSNSNNSGNNSSLPKTSNVAKKLKDFSPIDWKEAFPNTKMINEVFRYTITLHSKQPYTGKEKMGQI
jgi:hypothetical protein